MNFPEKPEDITKDDWLEKLHALHITRADMNRLIMNYLVTGKLDCFINMKVEKLHALHITRADMNRLIMNYLVTGKLDCLINMKVIFAHRVCQCALFFPCHG